MTTLPLHEQDTFGEELEFMSLNKGRSWTRTVKVFAGEIYRYFSRETILPSMSVAEKLYMDVAVCQSSVGADWKSNITTVDEVAEAVNASRKTTHSKILHI